MTGNTVTVRTRIAPSPTGEYHVGSLRTALYNYAFAKQNKGQFIIRIEDTDQKRYVPGSETRLLEVMRIFGLNCDEGPENGGPYAPYTQSKRLSLYKEHAEKLVKNGDAYYCFCTPERLDEMRKEQTQRGDKVTKYDKRCLHLSTEEIQKNLADGIPHVIRQRVPDNETIEYNDAFLGHISFNSDDIDNTVLLKSDGYPTYHLAVVVDDHLMHISHILRAMEWLPSTPKHILLYKAFGWETPVIGHMSDLKEKDANKKLSKRYGGVSVESFLAKGYLPEALLNFLMFLGWNPGTDKEIYSLDEFCKDFSLAKVQKSFFSSFDRDKLIWYNGVYIRNFSPENLLLLISDWSKKYAPNDILEKADKAYLLKVVELAQERLKTLAEFFETSQYFFEDPTVDRELLSKQPKDPLAVKDILKKFYDLYESVDGSNWTKENLETISHKLLTDTGLKPREAFMTLRVATTGVTATPPIFDTIALLGKDTVLRRINACQ
ncbi:MAG: hypothetical protein ACD_22C00180G0004 [uncultured bacterium]|nr:MAG: hypothetical protein ACD_22C00180G0004 [uncultured bacterium]